MRYAVIGTGGIGGYYGGKLARSGRDVHFLLHTDYDYVRRNGLQVDSCDGSFHLDNVNAYTSTADMPAVDVIIVGLKTTNNHLLPSLLRPLLDKAGDGRKPIVLLIQNGIGVEADVQRMLPDARLMAGLAFICSAKRGPGHIDHQCYGHINLGNYSVGSDDDAKAVADDMLAAGITARMVDYEEARWRKAVWNMPFNGMTVALGTQTDQLLKHPATRALIRRQMLEVIHAANACGVSAISEEFADQMIRNTDEMTPYSPSMKLDYDFHRPMEIEYLYSRPLAMAREAGVPMSSLEMLEAELMFLQEVNHKSLNIR